jgi:hypothetical protein
MEALRFLPQLTAHDEVERGERFVEHQQCRSPSQHPDQRQPLFLASDKRAGNASERPWRSTISRSRRASVGVDVPSIAGKAAVLRKHSAWQSIEPSRVHLAQHGRK